jgi:hypothetical protein
MPMPPSRDHRIPLEAAAALTRRFRKTEPAAIRAGMFPRAVFEKLLAQAGCAGIRIYNGREVDGKSTLVLVGVDADGDDMTTGELAQFWFPCPPFCSIGSALDG